ncbi:hypothetical protein SteCoe_2186 [Stentor coeruleus]|uniref:Uncharacterized protein n=1 Tax=Stentor coeruleus TaxID=5963 RepID=A0A1R2CZW1_9CILI|nr:hypothetical protein SteCoe_2186 [Stentor coeruleus]
MYGNLKPEGKVKSIALNYSFSPFAPKHAIKRHTNDLYKNILQNTSEKQKNFESSPLMNTETEDPNHINSFPNLPTLKTVSTTSRKEFISIVDFSAVTLRRKSMKPEITLKSKIKPAHFSKIFTIKPKRTSNLKEFIVKTKPIIQKKIDYPINSDETMKNYRYSLKSQDLNAKYLQKFEEKSVSPKNMKNLTPVDELIEKTQTKKESLRPAFLPYIKKKTSKNDVEQFQNPNIKETIFNLGNAEEIDLRGW